MVEIPSWVGERRKTGARLGRPPVYDWAGIEVGASLLIPVDAQSCTFRSFYVMAMANGRKLGRRFHVREREDGTFECWRER